MPRYLTEAGVTVNVPDETAQLVGGLTPIDQAAPEALADPDAVTAWLDAEAAYRDDVTAWLAAEADQATAKPQPPAKAAGA